MNAANASAVAACDAQDGVVDGVLGDPRACTFDAKNNICGMPGAPTTNCLTPQEADAVNRIWDGPRNDHGLRIWFPFGRGANAGVTNAPPFGGPGGSLGIFTWSHMDNNYDFTGQPLSQFDDETQLATREVAPYSDIISTDLQKARKRGAKILMWHGGADQLIPWRQSVHYYRETAERFGGFKQLQSWFRFYLAPGVTHCGGGGGSAAAGALRHDGRLGRERRRARLDPLDQRDARQPADVPVSADRDLQRQRRRPEAPHELALRRRHRDPRETPAWIASRATSDETGKHLEDPQSCSHREDHDGHDETTTTPTTTTATEEDDDATSTDDPCVRRGVLAAAHDDDAQYTISAPGTTLTGYVTGTTLPVQRHRADRQARRSHHAPAERQGRDFGAPSGRERSAHRHGVGPDLRRQHARSSSPRKSRWRRSP